MSAHSHRPPRTATAVVAAVAAVGAAAQVAAEAQAEASIVGGTKTLAGGATALLAGKVGVAEVVVRGVGLRVAEVPLQRQALPLDALLTHRKLLGLSALARDEQTTLQRPLRQGIRATSLPCVSAHCICSMHPFL